VTTRTATVLRAAEMYYLEQKTMDTIAEALGVSRATVSRMISEARTSGLVEITVHRDRRAAATLERLIAKRYHVDVTVVAPPENATDTDRLRHAAAQAGTVLRASLAPHLHNHVVGRRIVDEGSSSCHGGGRPFFEEVQHRGADPAPDLRPSGVPRLSCPGRGPGGAQAMALEARP
jgi:deoxyribonucleoside regulator